jgi:hypothetical protein
LKGISGSVTYIRTEESLRQINSKNMADGELTGGSSLCKIIKIVEPYGIEHCPYGRPDILSLILEADRGLIVESRVFHDVLISLFLSKIEQD